MRIYCFGDSEGLFLSLATPAFTQNQVLCDQVEHGCFGSFQARNAFTRGVGLEDAKGYLEAHETWGLPVTGLITCIMLVLRVLSQVTRNS